MSCPQKRKRSFSPDTKSDRRSYFCPHCNSNLSYSAFWSHKAKYYDQEKDFWTSTTRDSTTEDSPCCSPEPEQPSSLEQANSSTMSGTDPFNTQNLFDVN